MFLEGEKGGGVTGPRSGHRPGEFNAWEQCALQRERAKLIRALGAWYVEKEDIGRQIENLVASYAANNGLKLKRRELASPEEVMVVACPRHGAGPCWEDLRGSTLRRGCLSRQIEALRSDYLPPRVEAAGGGTGEEGCE